MTEFEHHYFESGRRGKGDERDTNLANAIGAFFKRVDRSSRFDVRVSGRYDSDAGRLVVDLAGEVSRTALQHKNLRGELAALVRGDFNDVERQIVQPSDIEVRVGFNEQSDVLAANVLAGDSGNAIAVAYANTPLNLPWERYLAVYFRDVLDEIFQQDGRLPAVLASHLGAREFRGMRSDGKISVSAQYDRSVLVGLTDITAAVQHEDWLPVQEVRRNVTLIIQACLDIFQETYGQQFKKPRIAVNTLGNFNRGGWYVDSGNREAKPYRDAFSSYGVTEDSFSGEDQSKPSCPLTLLARNSACWVVQEGYADFAKVTASVRIGEEDVHINVYTNGTLKKGLTQRRLETLLKRKVRPLTIQEAVSRFALGTPDTYELIRQTSDYFQNPNYPWNGKPAASPLSMLLQK